MSQPQSEDLSQTLLWTPSPGSRATCQVGRRIGAGGFAEVFEAELQQAQQPPVRVALKRLLPGLRGDPAQRRQLRREAQIAAYLNHPNIAKVLSLIELGDELALAMELCDGLQCNHLLHRLSQRGLYLETAAIAHIATGLFSALQYLENPLGQSRPLVHADISLENLMLTTSGEVKLIDFGIAVEDPGAGTAEHVDVILADEALTSLHQAAGKRPYIPPEGMSPRGPSSQSDLYAAGVCFWELLSGCRFPVLPRGVGAREMGSLIAFAAAGYDEPAWLLLKSCLAVNPESRLRKAGEGLLLCQRLGEKQNIAAELGALVQAVMAGSGALESPLCRPLDFLTALSQRLEGAFCAEAVTRCEIEKMRQAKERGFFAAPDGTLWFRVQPPTSGARAEALGIKPGAGCVYDALAQAVLKNLIAPRSA